MPSVKNTLRRIYVPAIYVGAGVTPYSDNFNRADGALGGSWEFDAGIWTIDTNQAKCTPATFDADVIVNGGFDADANWTKGAGWSIGAGVATRIAGTGSAIAQTVAPLTANRWYRSTITANVTASVMWFRWGTNSSPTWTIDTTAYRWANGTNFDVFGSTTAAGTIDNVTAQALTTSELIAAVDCAGADGAVSAAITSTPYSLAGVVARLDDQANPQNFLLAYLTAGSGSVNRASLIKCVGGTYTTLIADTAITYGATKLLKIACSGTSVALFYDGAQVGVTQTVTDAGIVSNTRYGMFSVTAVTNRIDNFRVA